MKRGIVMIHNELHSKWFDWLKDTNLEIVGIHAAGGNEAPQTLEELICFVNSAEGAAYIQRFRDMGMAVEYEYHAVSWMLPRSEFREHPQWFRMNREGERTPDYNLCPSNQEAMDFLTRRGKELCRLLPSDTGKYYMWQDDVDGVNCCCPRCRELSVSDQSLMMMHAILKGIRQVDSRAKLAYLAYFSCLEPPKKIAPQEGIFLEYAPFRRDLSKALVDPESEINQKHAEKVEPLLDLFGRKDSCVLEYWIDNSLQSDFKRPAKKLVFREDIIRKDIAWYQNMGFEKITSFAGYLDEDYCRDHGEPPVKPYGML